MGKQDDVGFKQRLELARLRVARRLEDRAKRGGSRIQGLAARFGEVILSVGDPIKWLLAQKDHTGEEMDAFIELMGVPGDLRRVARLRIALDTLPFIDRLQVEGLARSVGFDSVHALRNEMLATLGFELSHLHVVAGQLEAIGPQNGGASGELGRPEQVFDLWTLRAILQGVAGDEEARDYLRALRALLARIEAIRPGLEG